jgi:hypothetical protein
LGALLRPEVLRVPIDLYFLYRISRKEFGEGKIRPPQQQKISVVNGVVSPTVTEQPGHAHGIWIVVFQPLLAAKGIAHRRLQLVGQRQHLGARISAAVASEDRHVFRVRDHPPKLFHIGIRWTKNGRCRC